MQRWLLTSALSLILIQILISPSYTNVIPDCGEPLGAVHPVYPDIKPLSNGPNQKTDRSCRKNVNGDDHKGDYGYEYQCVEYVRRFYYLALHADISTWSGNAHTYFDMAANKGLTACPNGQTTIAPQQDDILVFRSPSDPDKCFSEDIKCPGHVAIITEVNTAQGEISLIEQNWSSTGEKILHFTNKDGLWLIEDRGSYVVAGWSRKVGNTPPPRLPKDLTQYASNGVTIIPIGSITNEGMIVLAATLTDPQDNTIALEAEFQPIGTLLTGIPNCTSGPAVASGRTATATCSGLSNGSYHWQVRAINSQSRESCWISAGGNQENAADFIVDVISHNFPISTALNAQDFPAIAFDGTNYLVIWRDQRNGNTPANIFGTRVTPAGVVLDPGGIFISSVFVYGYGLSIAFDGTNYLVIWADYPSGSSFINRHYPE